jgi:hypothetical protein
MYFALFGRGGAHMGTGWTGAAGTQAAGSASQRGRALSIFAVLFVLLAISNLLKPFGIEGSDTGFVFFGRRLSGAANAVLGPAFGVYLLVYAIRIWRMQRSALVMGYLYAAYVIINLVLFNLRNPVPPGVGYLIFGIVYAAIGIGVTWGTVYLLHQRRDALQ